MRRFVMCVGLPASGKSTWAEQQILKLEPGKGLRINRDLIREMLHANRFAGRKTESITETVRDLLLTTAMARNSELVISDDTNLDPKVVSRLESLARSHNYEFVIQSFTDVPVSTCVERDLKRSRSVGEKVIKGMYLRYLAPKHQQIEHDPSLPMAVIVDIDGTLAHIVDRSPYDWDRVDEDTVDEVVRELVVDVALRGDTIIVLSGRDGSCRAKTEKWLADHKVEYDDLFMRAAGDMRKDSVVKLEIFDREIRGKYNVRYVIDDRNQVVQMWRSIGLKVLQVEDGDF